MNDLPKIEVVYVGRRFTNDGKLYALFLPAGKVPEDETGMEAASPFLGYWPAAHVRAAIGVVYAASGTQEEDGKLKSMDVKHLAYVGKSTAGLGLIRAWELQDATNVAAHGKARQSEKLRKSPKIVERLTEVHLAWKKTPMSDRTAFELAVLAIIRRGPTP